MKNGIIGVCGGMSSKTHTVVQGPSLVCWRFCYFRCVASTITKCAALGPQDNETFNKEKQSEKVICGRSSGPDPHSFSLYITGQNLLTWAHLSTRETGKEEAEGRKCVDKCR